MTADHSGLAVAAVHFEQSCAEPGPAQSTGTAKVQLRQSKAVRSSLSSVLRGRGWQCFGAKEKCATPLVAGCLYCTLALADASHRALQHAESEEQFQPCNLLEADLICIPVHKVLPVC